MIKRKLAIAVSGFALAIFFSFSVGCVVDKKQQNDKNTVFPHENEKMKKQDESKDTDRNLHFHEEK